MLLLEIQKNSEKLKSLEKQKPTFDNCSTMGMGRKYSKEHHYTPFTYAKDEWNDDNDSKITVKIEPAKNGTNANEQTLKIEDEFFVLTASKSPEKLVLWWMEMEQKILQRPGLPWAERLSVLTRASTGEAKQIIVDAINQTGGDVGKHKWEKLSY